MYEGPEELCLEDFTPETESHNFKTIELILIYTIDIHLNIHYIFVLNIEICY